jgi:ABC-2 type transport system permease protein
MKKVFKIRRALAIARKETMHIRRDPFTLVFAIVIPVFLTVMFGFAIDYDIRNVHTAVYDADMTQTSRKIYQAFMNSDYFNIVKTGTLVRDPAFPLAREEAKLSLIIPHGFERDIFNGRGGQLQVLIDGADNTTSSLISGYVGGLAQRLNADFLKQYRPEALQKTVNVTPRFLFNPEQTSSWFIVPGLATVILAILSILLTSLTIAREWETGSMELLLSTPARPAEIIFGKLVPYVFLGVVATVFIYAAARTVFHIPFRGSYIAYFASSLLFIGTYLSMGLFISVAAKNQQLAMQISLMAGYMPSMLLSGFIFSIANMDKGWQMLTMLLPARWFMTICRACYLKEAGFIDLYVPFIALAVLLLLLFFAAVKKFKGNLE